jgi:malonyl CoA-acyl carrier protein transacylase
MSEKYCVMFAGQSVQESGMGKELLTIPAAAALIARLKPALGDDLEELLTTMPDPQLALTFNAQRAIHAHHLANWFAYLAKNPGTQLDGAIGHSMGVVAALVAAGALTPEDSGAFIRARAQAFSDVCKSFSEPMGLAAVSTESFSDVIDEAQAFQGVSVALHNTIGRGTLGGTTAALEAFSRKADEEGWPVKIRILKVEGPYHTKAFTPCKEALKKAAAALKISPPQVPVFMGTSGKAETDVERIRTLLVDQADSCELHLSAVLAAYEHGCRRFLEVAYKPQPVTWLSDQLQGVEAVAVRTADLA